MKMMSTPDSHFLKRRRQLVRQIERQGVRDQTVLNAIDAVPREAFISSNLHGLAYQNSPLPIGNDQTISQPYIVALMAELLELRPTDRVLEIGTGSGYAAAVLSRIAKQVYTIERYPDLAETARVRLANEGFDNVHVCDGDGTLGWEEHAPYDAIVVAAGSPDVPQPLLDQLGVGGRLVIPVGGDRNFQQLLRVRKTAHDRYDHEDVAAVRFVPLVGSAGWSNDTLET